MKIIITENYEELCKKAALFLLSQITEKPDSVLGLSTGYTPIGVYKNLSEWYQMGLGDYSQVTTFNLDEYKNVKKDNPQGYYYFMNEHLFSKVNLKEANVHIQESIGKDEDKISSDYEEMLYQAGGIDLQLLGLGHNGHIGFNEPADFFSGKCLCVELAESTICANKRFFENAEAVPKQAYTMGIGTIMRADKIMILVSGADKAEILSKALNGPITPMVPASILQVHKNVTVIADADAAAKL